MKKEKILFLSTCLILLLLIFNGFNYKEAEYDLIVDNFPETELTSLEDARYNFKDGQGIIQITCTNISGDGSKTGGVYVSVNGTIKLNITTNTPVNLRVKVNDVILVKGHNLSGYAGVKITDIAGNIDYNMKGTSINVGNLAKHFVTVTPEALD